MIPDAIERISGGNKVSDRAVEKGQEVLDSMSEKEARKPREERAASESGQETNTEEDELEDVIDIDLSDYERE